MERANSRALSPVPLADEPNDVPSMRYTGLVIGRSYITRVLSGTQAGNETRYMYPKAKAP
jgi:hypothetical protein